MNETGIGAPDSAPLPPEESPPSEPRRRLSRHASLLERFWTKVSVVPGPDGCWEWTAACRTNRLGQRYPEISHGKGSPPRAELVAIQLFEPQRQIPPEPRFLKTCDNELCVRPAHIQVMTVLELAAHRKSLRPEKPPKPPAQRPAFPVEQYEARQISAVWTLERTRELLAFLVGTRSIAAAARHFHLSRQRVDQVLDRLRVCAQNLARDRGGVMRPPSKPTGPKRMGIRDKGTLRAWLDRPGAFLLIDWSNPMTTRAYVMPEREPVHGHAVRQFRFSPGFEAERDDEKRRTIWRKKTG